MAAPKDVAPEGRALQWNDLKTNQRKIVSDNMRESGMNLPKTARADADQMLAGAADTSKKPARRKALGVAGRSLDAVAGKFKPEPISLNRAANHRQGLYNEGIAARQADNPGDKDQVIPHGAGWYFDHHKAIADSAAQHHTPKDWAIAAAGVMSPLNSPENEVASVHAMMDANTNHTVHIDQRVSDHLASRGIDVSAHIGQTKHFDSLPIGTVTHLASDQIRDHVKTGADLHSVARGGLNGNMVKAEHILAGNVHPDDAADPHSAPKVWSYIHNTRQAVPGTPTHVEYMGRVHHDAMVRTGQIDEHQGALDLYGTGEKTGGHMLSPQSHTVEDTWQNSATYNQPKETVNGRTSVFKAAGSMPNTYPAKVKTRVNDETGKRESAFTDSNIGNSALQHAFNNRATQKAAEQQSKGSGVTVPPIAMQEVGWTQMRKAAGKDSAYNNREVEQPDPLGGHVRGQQALWGEHIPGGEHTRASVPEHRDESGAAASDFTPSQHEAELRKWAAIGNNVQRARGRATASSRTAEFNHVEQHLR